MSGGRALLTQYRMNGYRSLVEFVMNSSMVSKLFKAFGETWNIVDVATRTPYRPTWRGN